jgi:hypothetical protein
MFKIIFFFVALTTSVAAKANLDSQEFGYKFCNHHKFTFFLLKPYDAYLCLDNKQHLYPEEIFKTDFSLIIKYNMNFNRKELVKSSIEEINRYYSLTKKDQNNYHNQLMSILIDIKKNDIVEAKYNKNGTVNFYHNKSLAGKISEEKLSKMFLNIWLYKDNKYKKMTKDLFKK